MTDNLRRALVSVCLLAAAIAAGFAAVWFGVPVPAWVWWNAKTEYAQPESDGPLTVSLYNHRLSVTQDGRRLWQTQRGWNVQDCLIGDIDRDGQQELLLLVWKRGSYGEHLPFWIEKNDSSLSQHIFIFRWRNRKPEAVWMSSALHPQVRQWAWSPNGDLMILTPAQEQTLWGWRTWGLQRVDAGGTFSF